MCALILTGILEVHIVAVDSILHSACHDFELHDLLSYIHVWFGDVDLHFRVIDLVGQSISHYLREVPNTTKTLSGCGVLTFLNILLLLRAIQWQNEPNFPRTQIKDGQVPIYVHSIPAAVLISAFCLLVLTELNGQLSPVLHHAPYFTGYIR